MEDYQSFLESAKTDLQEYLKENNIDVSVEDAANDTIYTVTYEHIDCLHHPADICKVLVGLEGWMWFDTPILVTENLFYACKEIIREKLEEDLFNFYENELKKKLY